MNHLDKIPTDKEPLVPSEEDLRKMEEIFGSMRATDNYFFQKQLTDLSFWYPILQDLGVPTPETYIIKQSLNLMELMDGKKVEGIEKLVDDIDYYAQKVGYPCFLRTGHTSNKHDWKNTCFLTKKEDIIEHLYALQEASLMADMFHPWSMSTIVVRKMIPTKPFFYFFGGNMPITREVRIFVKDGQIESVHPYWPEEAFYGIEDNKELQEKVKALNTFTEDDKKLFFIAGNLLAKSFPGYWSVDFLQDADGEWICIDMAVGETSYKNSESIDIN